MAEKETRTVDVGERTAMVPTVTSTPLTKTSRRQEHKPYENEYVLDDEIDKNGHCMEELMAFVNEFVSEEDIRKYDLDSLWARYHGKDWRVTGFRHAWTFDREREIWFIPVVSGVKSFPIEKPAFFI